MIQTSVLEKRLARKSRVVEQAIRNGGIAVTPRDIVNTLGGVTRLSDILDSFLSDSVKKYGGKVIKIQPVCRDCYIAHDGKEYSIPGNFGLYRESGKRWFNPLFPSRGRSAFAELQDYVLYHISAENDGSDLSREFTQIFTDYVREQSQRKFNQ